MKGGTLSSLSTTPRLIIQGNAKLPGRKGKDDLREKGIRREKGLKAGDVLFKISDLKNLRKRSSKLQTLSSMADSKNLKKHYQGWVLYRETVSHLGQKKKFQPTKNPKDESSWNAVLPEGYLLRATPVDLSAQGQTVGEKYSGIIFLRAPGRTLISGSPFQKRYGSPVSSTPVSVPGTASSSKKRQIADKGNLPYFRIWKTSIYSNRQEPTYRRLYKGDPNPRIRRRYLRSGKRKEEVEDKSKILPNQTAPPIAKNVYSFGKSISILLAVSVGDNRKLHVKRLSQIGRRRSLRMKMLRKSKDFSMKMVRKNPLNYALWFDYVRLLVTDGNKDKIRQT
ncbi:hypothetical protein YC2023_117045 [Brassica napus]